MSPILSLLVRSIVLLVFGAAIILLLRKRQASLRALVWTATLAGIVLLPMLSRALPEWRVGVLPAAPSTIAPPFASDPVPVTAQEVSDQPSASLPDPAPLPAGSSVSLQSEAPLSRPFPWLMLLFVVWALGSAILLLRLGASFLALHRIARSAGTGIPEWLELVDQVRAELGIRRAVRVKVSAQLNVPAVAGIWRPVLLLPEEAGEWAAAVRRDVARHELAHVARWDAMGQLIDHLACAMYWFNPLTWLAAGHAGALRERACDDVVLRSGTRASDYATNLLNLASRAGGAELRSAALAMARPNRIRERVMSVLNPGARRESISGRAAVAVVVMIAGAIGSVAALTPAARATDVVANLDETAGFTAPATSAQQNQSMAMRASASRMRGAPMVQDTTRLCVGGRHNSTSISEENGVRKWEMELTGPGCEVSLKARGKIEFNDDFTDIASISRNGYFRLDVTSHGVRRQLELTPSGSGLERVYRVDGAERPYDADARAWFAGFLIDLDRQTAVGVEQRLPRLLQQGGVAAVLNETGQMPSDYARNEYYTRLMDLRRLSPGERRQILEQAAKLMESDYYGAELIKRVVGQGRLQDPEERAAVVAMVKRMDSDYYKSEAMKVLLPGSITGEQMDALLEVTAGMESDYYKSEMLGALLKDGTLSATQRASVLKAATSIESDYYVGEVLKLLVSRGLMGDEERAAFLQAVSRMTNDYNVAEVLKTLLDEHEASAGEIKLIMSAVPNVESDYYRSEILGDVLQSKAVTEEDLISMVTLVRRMDSDYYESETLRRVLESRAVTDRVRRAVREAANDLQSYYRDEVRRASGVGDT